MSACRKSRVVRLKPNSWEREKRSSMFSSVVSIAMPLRMERNEAK
jgi:hypothetical protein